jgi:TPR repeat protein
MLEETVALSHEVRGRKWAFLCWDGIRIREKSENADETNRLYRRACLLGVANACTNYAAAIWAKNPAAAELTCARRIFEKACAASEPFACGMVGRVMLESTTPPPLAEGRKYLEDACNGVGGFPCRVLARHLESGKLGDYDPQRIRALLKQACDGGDPDACGEHATARETFH